MFEAASVEYKKVYCIKNNIYKIYILNLHIYNIHYIIKNIFANFNTFQKIFYMRLFVCAIYKFDINGIKFISHQKLKPLRYHLSKLRPNMLNNH